MDTKGMGFTPPPPPRPASSCARHRLPAARNEAVPHVRRKPLHQPAAHWRASGILPASLSVPSQLAVSLPRMLERIGLELTGARSTQAGRLRQRAQLILDLLAPATRRITSPGAP